jgi:chromosome segregation ATPase
MRKILMATALLLVVLFAGCSQEKAQVTNYLKELEASNNKMKGIAEEMQTSMGGLQQEIASGNFDAEAIKGQIQSFADQMDAEKKHIEGLTVPAKAQALQDAAVKQYQTAVDVLGETIPMIDIAKRMSDAAQEIKADPSKAKAIMEDMKSAQTEMQEIQKKVAELATQGKGYEDTVKAEQKKLQEEFGIEAKTEEAGGEKAGGEEAGGEEAGGAEEAGGEEAGD